MSPTTIREDGAGRLSIGDISKNQLLEVLLAEEREACALLVQAERDKLGGRWSLDSAYLAQAIAAIRARTTGWRE